MTVKYKDQRAYSSSKTKEFIYITGTFEITDKVLNGRTKVVKADTGKVYWVEITQDTTKEDDVSEVKEVNEATSFIYHLVKEDDTYSTIAKKYNMTRKEVEAKVQTLCPGQLIRVK